MKTLKNLFTALFAVALLTSFVACSNGDDEEDLNYGCGELANTEWVMIVSVENQTEVGGYGVSFTATQFTMSTLPDQHYDIIINESEGTFKMYQQGMYVQQEIKYEFKNDEKTIVEIFNKEAGEWDSMGFYKKKTN